MAQARPFGAKTRSMRRFPNHCGSEGLWGAVASRLPPWEGCRVGVSADALAGRGTAMVSVTQI